jgi:hypothetical protein
MTKIFIILSLIFSIIPLQAGTSPYPFLAHYIADSDDPALYADSQNQLERDNYVDEPDLVQIAEERREIIMNIFCYLYIATIYSYVQPFIHF